MTTRILLSLILFVPSFAAQAQVYKWVDADGKVTFSDVPPPKTAVKVETRAFADTPESSASMPFELAEAAKSMPVTLYTTSKCTPCDDGRSFLKQNGIPFSEKTVSTDADLEKLNAVAGATQLPVLTIGKSKFRGYNSSDWRSSLSQAGYPDSNMLPADYRFPPAQPAAPTIATKSAVTVAVPRQSEVPQRDPNGFQF